MHVEPIRWRGNALDLLDQRLLPREVRWVTCTDAHEVAVAIRDMIVRGAPAIGVSAAFGVALAAQRGDDIDAACGQLVGQVTDRTRRSERHRERVQQEAQQEVIRIL